MATAKASILQHQQHQRRPLHYDHHHRNAPSMTTRSLLFPPHQCLMPLLICYLLLQLSSSFDAPSPTCGTAYAQGVSPIGKAVSPFGSSELHQFAYDPTNHSLYIADSASYVIVQVSQVNKLSLTPFTAAPWSYSVVAGTVGVVGLPNITETRPLNASFHWPFGVAGWPQYAVGPTTHADQASGATQWVGLWVCEYYDNVIRFINFRRGNNVTLAAGRANGTDGNRDGIGAGASLFSPINVAWGRFFRSLVLPESGPGAGRGSFSTPGWTSVIYWSEQDNDCVRQGVPMHNVSTKGGSLLSGLPSESLGDMVLNVSTFAGLCGSNGNATGAAYRRRVFIGPYGIALLNVFPSILLHERPYLTNVTSTGAVVLFVGESRNGRLSMISPMYPPSARFLTVLWVALAGGNVSGVTLGRVLPPTTSSVAAQGTRTMTTFLYSTSVELFIGVTGNRFWNISTSIQYVLANGSLTVTLPSAASVVANTSLNSAFNAALIRYTPNSTYNGTLVVFGGFSAIGPVLYFYCCLSTNYSMPDSLTAFSDNNVVLSLSETLSISSSTSGSPSYPTASKAITSLTSTSSVSGTSSASRWSPTGSHPTASSSVSVTKALMRTRTKSTRSESVSSTSSTSVSLTRQRKYRKYPNSHSYTSSITMEATPTQRLVTPTRNTTRSQTQSYSSSRPTMSLTATMPTSSPSVTNRTMIPTMTVAPSTSGTIPPTRTLSSSETMSSETVSSSRSVHRRSRSQTGRQRPRRRTPTPAPPHRDRTHSMTWPPPVQAVIAPAVLATVGAISGISAGVSSGSGVATALAAMGLAERCLIPLDMETNVPLAFPTSAVPGWRLGNSSTYPKLPYYRAAAVGSLLAHLVAVILGTVVGCIMVFSGSGRCMHRRRWYTDGLMRFPLTALMVVDGLFLDGGVAGGAISVHAEGAAGLGYLMLGLVGPLATMVLVAVLVWRRTASYDENYLLQNASTEKRQALFARRRTPLGLLHRFVVGMGAWREVDGPKQLQLAAFWKYRGSSLSATGTSLGSMLTWSNLQGWRSRLPPYYFAFAVAANVILSGTRAAATPSTCIAPSAIAALVCTFMAIFFSVLQPLTSLVKNIVGTLLVWYAAINALALFGAAVDGSPSIIYVALSMAEWQAFLGVVSIGITVASFCLSQWATCISGKAARRAVGYDDDDGEEQQDVLMNTTTTTMTLQCPLLDPAELDDVVRIMQELDENDKNKNHNNNNNHLEETKDNVKKEMKTVDDSEDRLFGVAVGGVGDEQDRTPRPPPLIRLGDDDAPGTVPRLVSPTMTIDTMLQDLLLSTTFDRDACLGGCGGPPISPLSIVPAPAPPEAADPPSGGSGNVLTVNPLDMAEHVDVRRGARHLSDELDNEERQEEDLQVVTATNAAVASSPDGDTEPFADLEEDVLI